MNISVIVPAYNAEDTILDTLESLIAQTYPNWEAIVVDDGSTDETAKLVGRFVERDTRIRLIRQPNGGESAARNAGIAHAVHDWLLFLDSDDWISPQHLRRLTDELLSNHTLDAVHCGSARVALDGTLTIEEYLPPSGDMFPTLARRAAFPIHACIVRKSLVEAVGIFDPSFQKSSDWDLWQRIARTGAQFGAVREILAFYRTRPNSVSLDAHLMLEDGLRVLRQGHAPDPRVKNPHANHAKGQPPEQIRTQEFYLLSWCAGLLLGCGKAAQSLLEQIEDDNYPELYADAVAQCIFEAGVLPTGRALHEWEELWPHVEPHLDKFLAALEAQSMSPDLARRARNSLLTLIENHSIVRRPITQKHELTLQKQQDFIAELRRDKRALDIERKKAQKLAEDRNRDLQKKQAAIEEIERAKVASEKDLEKLQQIADEQQKSLQAQQAFIHELERDKLALEKERDDQHHLAEERQTTITALQGKLWVRLGLRLRILRRPDAINYEGKKE